MPETTTAAFPRSRQIVVGVDGSRASIDALRWAGRVATGLSAQLVAVVTWQYPSSYGEAYYPADWHLEQEAAGVLERAVQEAFGDEQPQHLKTKVIEGYPAGALMKASAGTIALVVGNRGHGGFVGLLIGSVSGYCVDHADCPVVVVHARKQA